MSLFIFGEVSTNIHSEMMQGATQLYNVFLKITRKMGFILIVFFNFLNR